MKTPMTLSEIITTLMRKDQESRIMFSFVYFYPTTLHSYRGVYAFLAVGYDNKGEPPLVKDFIKLLESAIGKTYTGYKGGEFVMHERTPLFVANIGEAGQTGIIDVVDGDYGIELVTGKVNI